MGRPGLSPLTRGKPEPDAQGQPAGGPIPADAGETERKTIEFEHAGAYPR